MTLPKASGTFTNSGTTTVATGKSLTSAAASQVWNQDGGTLSVTSTFSMLGGVFNSNGGAISGTLTLDDSDLNFGTATATGTPTFIMRGTAARLAGGGPANGERLG